MDDQKLYQLISCQQALNSLIRREPTSSSLERLFIEFSSLIADSMYRAVVTKILLPCEFCQKTLTPSGQGFPCGHYICSQSCFFTQISHQLGSRLSRYENLKCACGESIPRSCTKLLFGGEEEFKIALNKSEKENEPKLLCQICEGTYPASDFITFDCDHRYCQDCVKMSLDYMISEGKVGNEICCPECKDPVNPQIIYAILDYETKEKYDGFLIRNLAHSEANSGEYFVMCIGRPGVNCTYGQYIAESREEFTCPQCAVVFCPKCKLEVHPKITCDQQKDLKNISDPYFRIQIKEGKMKICPWCKTLIEKDEGCKYILCKSEDCKKTKRGFCWDCGAKLSKEHEVHQCITQDVISNRIKKFFKTVLFIKS